MSNLLALSFDAAASPRISLKSTGPASTGSANLFGWGIAWYPPEERGAVVLKDPSSNGNDQMSRLLRDWSRFRSTTFLCHLRGAARRPAQQDTHPFVRSHAGRDWVLTQNGSLQGDWREQLSLGAAPACEPLGKTDTEHVLCWLLGRLREAGVRNLADVGWQTLLEWLAQVNALGTANLLLSDGMDLVAYQDAAGSNPLRWFRRCPPQETFVLENDLVELELSDARDRSRSFVLVATTALGTDWQTMSPGQMLVFRRGALTWDSATAIGAAAGTRIAGQGPTPLAQWHSVQRTQQAATVSQHSGGNPLPTAAHQARTPPVLSPGSRVLRIIHNTTYRYEAPIERSFHLLRLRPVHNRLQEVLEHRMEVTPPGIQQKYEDVFGNEVVRLDIETTYSELRFAAESLVRIDTERIRELNVSAGRTGIPLVWMPWQRQMMTPYLLPHELPETQLRELFDYAMSFVERQDYNLTETLLDMNTTINRDYAYIQGVTTTETTPFEVYTTRRGVCQDFANLLICLARLLGVPARYRTGYIHTGADYANKVQSDATHAWVEAYLPWYGWYGLDPTNGSIVNQDHVRVACGRNFLDATPTSGTIFRGGGREELSIDVRVHVVQAGEGP